MKLRNRIWILPIVLIIVFPFGGCATPTRSWEPLILKNNALSPVADIPPPPTPGSTTDRKDFDEILSMQRSRTPEECRRAGFEVKVSLDTFFGPPYGPLSAQEVHKWTPLFEKVRRDSGYFSHQVKDHWNRLRPYDADKRVQPCIQKEKSYAYPSGHATIARVFAHVLGQLDPARKTILEARADQIAEDRVLGGVHHPSDIEGAKRLGDHIFEVMMKNETFRHELEAQSE
jgi:acid phosphatase (class A)